MRLRHQNWIQEDAVSYGQTEFDPDRRFTDGLSIKPKPDKNFERMENSMYFLSKTPGRRSNFH